MVYTCPICDQVMKSKHFCRNCMQFVRTPYVREVTYYLNERHPQDETNCEYHMPSVRESGGADGGRGAFWDTSKAADIGRRASGREGAAPDGGRKAFRDADAVKRQMASMKEHAQEMARTFSESQKEQNKNPIVTVITVIAGILALLISISD